MAAWCVLLNQQSTECMDKKASKLTEPLLSIWEEQEKKSNMGVIPSK
jgi:hypothetical protein